MVELIEAQKAKKTREDKQAFASINQKMTKLSATARC